MLGILLPGNKEVRLKEFPDPEPKPDQVLIRIKASQICRSDMSLYYGWALVGKAEPGTVIAGHHQAGVVEKIGNEIKHLKRGDRVSIWCALGCGHCKYCKSGWYQLCSERQFLGFDVNGGFAELLTVPERICMRMPEKMSFVTGAFAEPICTLYDAAKNLGVSGDNSVAIFGIGPMGGAGLLICKALGAKVFCVDPVEERLRIAKSLGADEAINAKDDPVKTIKDLTEGEGADMAIECSGNPTALGNALDCVGRFGKVSIVGECPEAKIKPSEQYLRKRLTVLGSWAFNITEFEDAAKLVVEKDLNIEALATHRFSLKDASEAFKLFDEKKAIVVFTS